MVPNQAKTPKEVSRGRTRGEKSPKIFGALRTYDTAQLREVIKSEQPKNQSP